MEATLKKDNYISAIVLQSDSRTVWKCRRAVEQKLNYEKIFLY